MQNTKEFPLRLEKDPLLLGTLEVGQDLSIDPEILEELKTCYSNCIHGFIKRMMKRFDFSVAGVDAADLLQCSYILMIIAYKNYKPDTNNKFLTYFYWYLINGFRGIVMKKRVPLLIVPEIIEEPKYKYNYDLGIPQYNHPMPVNRSSSLYDGLRQQLDICVESLHNEGHLDIEEIQILNMRRCGYNMKEIGEKMGLSRERIRQILMETIRKIQGRHKLIQYEEKIGSFT